MNILPISDIHGNNDIFDYIIKTIDSDTYDILTCSGDAWEGSGIYNKQQWIDFQKEINLPIIMIQGNHDYFPLNTFEHSTHIHLLHNEGININGVYFWGTPYTPLFGGWNHMKSEDELYEMWSNEMPDNIDVLLSHGPPRGYGDNCNQPVYTNNSDSTLGSASLREIILEKNPKYVICGHIHTGDRVTTMDNGTVVCNVSCMDETYTFLGFNPPPVVLELEL